MDIVRSLLSIGADPAIQNHNGETALDNDVLSDPQLSAVFREDLFSSVAIGKYVELKI